MKPQEVKDIIGATRLTFHIDGSTTSSPNLSNAKKPDQVKELSPIVRELLSPEPRIRLHSFADDVDDNKFFFLTKDHIHIPYALPTIEHEIAHAVEMQNPVRWTLPDWGLSNYGNRHVKMSASKLFAAVARETRVRAIQLHLEKDLINRRSTCFNILSNETWSTWVRQFIPFGRFKNYQDVNFWIEDLRDKTYKAWNLDRIRYEWSVRLAHMQNWMETRQAA
jgi:hypothetical protein